ncbi:MAG: hypothetical protein K0S49_795 [Microbacterium sp.]|jgi:uncharacterized protein (TIGR00369 family)|nr:hypothetical protein [Microbacterium sp.]
MDDAEPRVSDHVERRIRASFARQGLMAHLGAELTHVAPGRVHITLPQRPEVGQQHGYVHAGATSTIADSAGGYLEAIGTVERSGRTLTVCHLEVLAHDHDRCTPVAVGQQTLIRITNPQHDQEIPS